MAISNIPTFSDGEILTASKLNEIGTAVEAKFSGGVSGADIGWPFVAQGNIDMNQNVITNLQKFWNVVNVSEYDTFTDAVAALPTNGGSLFIEPGTVTTDGVEIDTSNTLVFGTGRGSVLKITSGSTSGYLVRTTAGLTNIAFSDLTIDGNTGTGSGQDGVQVRDVDGVRISNVYFDDFSGEALVLTNSGTAGNPCENVVIQGCHFDGGSGAQLLMDDADGVIINGCHFESPTTKGINGTPQATASKMRSILVQGCTVHNCSSGIYIVGGGATASGNWELIRVNGCEVTTDSGVGVTCGTTSAVVQSSQVTNNFCSGITSNAFNVCIEAGVVSGNFGYGAGADGIDLHESQNLWVQGNNFGSAGAIGIRADDSTSCIICNNNVTGATTEGIDLNGATTPTVRDNIGFHDGSGGTVSAASPGESKTGIYAANYVIPASTVKVGDVIRVAVKCSSAAGTPTLIISLDGGTTDLTVGQPADGRAMGVVEFVVEALTGAASTLGQSAWTSETAAGAGDAGADAQTWTVDWTADVTITFQSTGSDISLDYYSVEILGGNS